MPAPSAWRRHLVSDRGLLALVLAIALLHALFEARSRPLYQVPDEMAYLRAAQVVALEGATPAERLCIAPPDGRLLETGEGGKTGFRLVTGLQLHLLCQVPDARLPLFALRAWQAVSLPLVAWASWYLAVVLTGRRDVGLLAALLVAVHPVAAVFAGGVTPDAWANAFSAGAFVAATRLALARDRWWDAWMLGVCIVGGLLWKDTTSAMLALVPMVVVVRVAGAGRPTVEGRRARPAAAIASVVVFGAIAAGLATALVSPYVLQAETPLHLLEAPWTSSVRVVADAALHARGLLASSLQSLYRPLTYLYPVPNQPLTPPFVTLVYVALLAMALAGAVRAATCGDEDRRLSRRRVFAVWLPAAALCFVQPSIRQIVAGVEELHQGRWLFPLLAPAAALVATWVFDLVGRRHLMPLFTVATLSSLWAVILDVVRHYFVAFPGTLATGVLFTRPTGDHDIGDALVLQLIARTAEAQTPFWTWGILVLLVVTCLGLTVAVIPHATSSPRHV